MRTVAGLLCALAPLACWKGPAPVEVETTGSATPWTGLDLARDPGEFSFVVVGDRTGGHREGVFARTVTAIDRLRPDFVVSIGDLVEGAEDEADLPAMWDEFDALVAQLSMPFFYVPGNHDYANPVMARDWRRRFGPSYYFFRYRDVLFLVLNSELISSYWNPGHPVEGGDQPEQQMRFAERVLAENADARWTFVFLHQPFWDTPGEHRDWDRVEELLGDRPYTVFAGHFHRYTKHVRHGRDYITLATAGGVSRLRGIARGEFDHVALVTMTGDGPVVANLMLDGIQGADVRTLEERELVTRLDRVVTTEPLEVAGARFRAGEQRFALANPTERPVTVRARFDLSPDFDVSPRSATRTLPARGSDVVAVSLRAHAPVPLEELTPSLAHWTVESEIDGAPVSVENTSWLVPDRRFPVPRTTVPVTVDGDLGEWGPLRFALEEWPEADGGAAEASLRFDVRRDADFVYLAFAVRDPSPSSSAERRVDAQDGLTVELDARPDPARSANAPVLEAIEDGTVASLLITDLAPVEGVPVMRRVLPPPPEGLRRAVQTDAGGYRAELAVPTRFLDERAGGAWQGFRLNVELRDFAGGEPGYSLRWRPSRFAPPSEAIEGAGTFVRE